MVVKHGANGWDAYCWRCSDDGFVPHPQPSMAERLARLKQVRQAEQEAEADPRPPMPAEFDPARWPLQARVWLYKAGFTNDTIRGAGLYHCSRLDRVVLPVIRDGRLCYWQARGFDPERPKYLNPKIDKTNLTADYGQGDTLVITEDVLSAIRVGEVAEARSILGTALSDGVAASICAADKPVAIWLDPDAAGRRGATKAKRKLDLIGVRSVIVKSGRDPKLYSKEEICSILSASCSP